MSRSSWRYTRVFIACTLFAASAAQASAEPYAPGSANDPRIRAARFLGEDKRHFSALTELLKLQSEVPMPTAAQFPWLLADNYLSFGLRDRAGAIYQPLGVSPSDPMQFARSQLKLAEFEYARGYLPEASSTLQQLRENLPEELFLEWQDLLARVQLAQGRDNEAIETITAPKNGGDQTYYTRYNLGLALIKAGRTEQGRTELDKVGDLKPTDRDSLALMDRANLTLGWNLLQAKQSDAARPILRRVRVEGPYSNRALLGLGWSELASGGKSLPRKEEDEDRLTFASFSTLGVMLRRGLDDDMGSQRSFRAVEGSSEAEKALNNALPAWLILIDRDPQDPAVQEGWLAIPYALDQLGAHEQARNFYEEATQRLEAARVRTSAAIDALRTNRMVETIVKRDLDAESGWDWELKDLPDAPETYYLQTMLAENRFAEGLKNYRDTRLLTRNLEAWDRRLAELEKSFGNANRASVDPRVLIARAKENHATTRESITIELRYESSMAEPGRYRDAVSPPPLAPPALALSTPPPSFAGTFENVGDLRKRLTSLLPALTKAGDEQGRFLQRMATKELQAQKAVIDKYLVEARFALARLYDRQLNSSDPDEYEIKK